jgi:hypothetical protein
MKHAIVGTGEGRTKAAVIQRTRIVHAVDLHDGYAARRGEIAQIQ